MAFFTSSASFIVPATVVDMQNYTSFLSANSRLFNSVQASFPENASAPLTTYDPPSQEGTMSSAMRQLLSLLLVWLLCVSTSLAARTRVPTQAPASQKPTLQVGDQVVLGGFHRPPYPTITVPAVPFTPPTD